MKALALPAVPAPCSCAIWRPSTGLFAAGFSVSTSLRYPVSALPLASRVFSASTTPRVSEFMIAVMPPATLLAVSPAPGFGDSRELLSRMSFRVLAAASKIRALVWALPLAAAASSTPRSTAGSKVVDAFGITLPPAIAPE